MGSAAVSSLSWVIVFALLASCDAGEGAQQPGVLGPQPIACAPPQQLCGSACVDVSTNAASCGACGMPCAPGEACEGGVCRAACLGTVCATAAGAACVSLSDDRSHCGACNSACAGGDACVAGRCVLDCGALTACGASCVDLLADSAHCGACGAACAGSKACVQGACACPAGLLACGETCVDTALDPEHCGGCDRACEAEGLCEGGRCVGPDGCTDMAVAGLTLEAIDLYQTVQIAIMEGGAAIASAQRNADVVAGRKALFRIYVAPQAGWVPRAVSARVELSEGDAPAQRSLFFAPLTPTAASSDADPASTFQVIVPGEAITAQTRYAVSLVECEERAAPVMALGARFPAAESEALGARETGPLKVHIIPIGSPAPDTSDEGLRAFKARLEAVFPITEVELTVGPALQTAASSMCSALGSIATRRGDDGAAPDVYYYGLTAGILGGQSGCSNASPSALGSKTSVGWAQGFTPDDGETGAATMCHELGHAHGRQHAPCNVQDPDGQYPYPNADIGVWAFDARSEELYEPTRKDMMSYCPEPRWAAWISDYNYQAILERVIDVNALAEVPALHAELDAAVSFRVLVSDSAGLHWIEAPLRVHGTPEGTPLRAIIYGALGPLLQLEVYKQELHDGATEHAFMLVLPELHADWRAIEVPGLLAPLALP